MRLLLLTAVTVLGVSKPLKNLWDICMDIVPYSLMGKTETPALVRVELVRHSASDNSEQKTTKTIDEGSKT